MCFILTQARSSGPRNHRGRGRSCGPRDLYDHRRAATPRHITSPTVPRNGRRVRRHIVRYPCREPRASRTAPISQDEVGRFPLGRCVVWRRTGRNDCRFAGKILRTQDDIFPSSGRPPRRARMHDIYLLADGGRASMAASRMEAPEPGTPAACLRGGMVAVRSAKAQVAPWYGRQFSRSC